MQNEKEASDQALDVLERISEQQLEVRQSMEDQKMVGERCFQSNARICIIQKKTGVIKKGFPLRGFIENII